MRALAAPFLVVGALAALGAGCAETADVPPLGDYTTWARFDFIGPAPGHGDDTYRIIYANPLATEDPSTQGSFPDGAILVKEIHANDGGQPGALDYVAIMRRLGGPPPTLTATGGWTFTYADEPGGEEKVGEDCWSTCHVAAPYLGAWYNYHQPPD